MMLEQLEKLLRRDEEIAESLRSKEVLGDSARVSALMKEEAELRPIVSRVREIRAKEQEIEENRRLLENEKDEELRTLAKEEIQLLRAKIEALNGELRALLVPKDPNDGKNVVLEIRGGAGGEEAALFAADLYRMYLRYAERMGWKAETTEYNESGIGGASKITSLISGRNVYSFMKFESGVHRVQRVPKTESQGRIHTSTVTVAVLPEAEEVEVEIDLNECRFDVFRASGNGGQCVNTTDSAVRLTHLPTGIVISCQDEKSQLKNRAKALKVLRARLYDLKRQEAHDKEASERRSLVGTGDRSEKIRTYNFPQGRVTDHRVNLSIYNIAEIMDGGLGALHEPLIAAERAAKEET